MGLFDGNLKEELLKIVEEKKQNRMMAQEQNRMNKLKPKEYIKTMKETYNDTISDIGLSKRLHLILLEDTAGDMPYQATVFLNVLKDSSVLMSYSKSGSFSSIFDLTRYSFVDFDWMEDIQNKGKKVIGRSIVGAMVAGPAGMIIGGVTGGQKTKDKSVAVVTLQNLETLELRMLSFKCEAKDAVKYKSVPKSKIIEDAAIIAESEPDALDQLKKLKELLDMDAITQQEFDNKKMELLGDI